MLSLWRFVEVVGWLLVPWTLVRALTYLLSLCFCPPRLPRINENHSIDCRLKVTLAAQGFSSAVSGVCDVSIGFAARREVLQCAARSVAILLLPYAYFVKRSILWQITIEEKRTGQLNHFRVSNCPIFVSLLFLLIFFRTDSCFCEGVLIHRVLLSLPR